jgi:hypothetical protein
MPGSSREVQTRAITPTCPACHADVPVQDINAAKGIMLCRACGRLGSISTGDSELPWPPEGEPTTRPPDAATRCEQIGTDLHLRRRCGGIGTGIFFALWLCPWTIGCVFLLRQAILAPSIEHVLFATPFLASWVFVALLVPYNLFGRESLRITRDGLHYEWGALIRAGRRGVPLDVVQRITRFSTAPDSDTGRREHGLKIETDGRPIRFAKGAQDEELRWLTDMIQRQLYAIRPGSAARDLAGSTLVGTPSVRRPHAVPESLELQSPPLEQPVECSLILSRSFQQTVLTRRTAWRPLLGGIGGLLFINLFWNGIVSVFVLQLIRKFQWFLFFFLIPFEAIGLVMLSILVVVLASPFMRTKWIFRPGEILQRVTVFGIGRTYTYQLSRLARLELRSGRKRKKWAAGPTDDEDDGSSSHGLGLVNGDGSDLVEIGGLTQAEARWLGDELLHDFREWLIKVGR